MEPVIAAGLSAQEIGERARRLAELAHRDRVSGLPNRLGLERGLIDHLRGASQPVFFAVLGIDPARAGGAMQAAARLRRVEGDWLVGRLALDTLGVAFSASDLDLARARLNAALAGLADQGIAAAAGIAAFPAQAHHATVLIAHAEIALAQARARTARISEYDGAQRAAGDAALMADLRAGLARGEVFLCHQPKLDLQTGAISGVEALARWRHPARGFVSPDEFVAVAEETGDIAALTEWTLARAAADARAFAAAGRDLTVSVNISAPLFGDERFAGHALEAARGASLCFEITETAVMEDPALAARALAKFAAAGIDISIDDFGARLSSFDYLQRLAAQELKIDKSFVTALEAGGEALMAETISLAHALGLKVTVEGVENQATLARVKHLGADRAQGNIVAPPMEAGALLAFLEAR